MRFALLLCALLPCVAAAADPRVRTLEYLSYGAVTADMVTTHAAVHNLGMEEGNPLLGQRPGDGLILLSGIARYALTYGIAHGSYASRTKVIALTVLDCVQLGVVGNNLSTISRHGIPAPLGIGIGVSIPLGVDFRPR